MSEENKVDLPFRAEYAKSGRAKCKGCKSEIPKGDCRLASLTQVIIPIVKNWLYWIQWF